MIFPCGTGRRNLCRNLVLATILAAISTAEADEKSYKLVGSVIRYQTTTKVSGILVTVIRQCNDGEKKYCSLGSSKTQSDGVYSVDFRLDERIAEVAARFEDDNSTAEYGPAARFGIALAGPEMAVDTIGLVKSKPESSSSSATANAEAQQFQRNQANYRRSGGDRMEPMKEFLASYPQEVVEQALLYISETEPWLREFLSSQ